MERRSGPPRQSVANRTVGGDPPRAEPVRFGNQTREPVRSATKRATDSISSWEKASTTSVPSSLRGSRATSPASCSGSSKRSVPSGVCRGRVPPEGWASTTYAAGQGAGQMVWRPFSSCAA
ncbi:hypothetical protein GCM10010504_40220 [Streptomyces griseus]|nr:hypothetical protein GCM10010504_40220 [Streptomyces griseus]